MQEKLTRVNTSDLKLNDEFYIFSKDMSTKTKYKLVGFFKNSINQPLYYTKNNDSVAQEYNIPEHVYLIEKDKNET